MPDTSEGPGGTPRDVVDEIEKLNLLIRAEDKRYELLLALIKSEEQYASFLTQVQRIFTTVFLSAGGRAPPELLDVAPAAPAATVAVAVPSDQAVSSPAVMRSSAAAASSVPITTRAASSGSISTSSSSTAPSAGPSAGINAVVSYGDAEVLCGVFQQLHKQHLVLRQVTLDADSQWRKTPRLSGVIEQLLPLVRHYRDVLTQHVAKLIYLIDALRFEPALAFTKKFLSPAGSAGLPLPSFRDVYVHVLDHLQSYQRFANDALQQTPLIHDERDSLVRACSQIKAAVFEALDRTLQTRKQLFLPSVRAGLRPSMRLAFPHRLQREGLLTTVICRPPGKYSSQRNWVYLFDDLLVYVPIVEKVGLLSATSSLAQVGRVVPLKTTWVVQLPDSDYWSNAFVLSTPEQELTFAARSSAERDIWLRTIVACIQFSVGRNAEDSPMLRLYKAVRSFNANRVKATINSHFGPPPHSPPVVVAAAAAAAATDASSPDTDASEPEADAAAADPAAAAAASEEKYHAYTARDLKIAVFLLKAPGLARIKIGEYLASPQNRLVLAAFCSLFDFTRMSFTDALRRFLTAFRLSGEAQAIDRVMNHFAHRYIECNPGSFSHVDTAYVVAFSLILLNTDAFNPNIKNKMQLSQFISNNRGIDQGKDLDPKLLEGLYYEIVNNEIRNPAITDAEVEQTMWLLDRDFVGSSDVLVQPPAVNAAQILGQFTPVPEKSSPSASSTPSASQDAADPDASSADAPTSTSNSSSGEGADSSSGTTGSGRKQPLDVLLLQTMEPRYAKYRFSDGSVYRGSWINCKPHGIGQKAYPAASSGLTSSTGRKVQMLYEGQWVSGTMDGQGSLTHFDWSCSFAGVWSNWRGVGTIKYEDGRLFTGEWALSEPLHSCLSGFGTLTRLDQSSYVGFMYNHAITGFGLLRRSAPSCNVLGTWIANDIAGFGPLFSPRTGDLLLSGWRAGLVYGPGVWATRSGVTIHSIKLRGPWSGKIHSKQSSVEQFNPLDMFFGCGRYLPLWPALVESFCRLNTVSPLRPKHCRPLMGVFARILTAWCEPIFLEEDTSQVLLSSVAAMVHSFCHYLLFMFQPKSSAHLASSTGAAVVVSPPPPSSSSAAGTPSSGSASADAGNRSSLRRPSNLSLRLTAEPPSIAGASPPGLAAFVSTAASYSPTALPLPNYANQYVFQAAVLPSLSSTTSEPSALARATPLPVSEVFAPAMLASGPSDAESLDPAALLQELWQHAPFAGGLLAWQSRRFAAASTATATTGSEDAAQPDEDSSPEVLQAIAQLKELPAQRDPYAKMRCLARVLECLGVELGDDADLNTILIRTIIRRAAVPNLRAELEILRYFAVFQNQALAPFLCAVCP